MLLCAAELSSGFPACGRSLRCLIPSPPEQEQRWKACSLFCYAGGDVSLLKRAALGLQPRSWWQQAGLSAEVVLFGASCCKIIVFPSNPGRSEREKKTCVCFESLAGTALIEIPGW